jgi:hypothetical protein
VERSLQISSSQGHPSQCFEGCSTIRVSPATLMPPQSLTTAVSCSGAQATLTDCSPPWSPLLTGRWYGIRVDRRGSVANAGIENLSSRIWHQLGALDKQQEQDERSHSILVPVGPMLRAWWSGRHTFPTDFPYNCLLFLP